MAQAIRTKNVRQIQAGEMTVQVRRPMNDHPRTVYGTFRLHRRHHFVASRDIAQAVRVTYTVTLDDGMLQDLLARAARNKSGKAVRGAATAEGGRVTVDERIIPALVIQAADTRGRKALHGPLVARVKLLEQPAPYDPLCRHCERPGVAHEYVAEAYQDYLQRRHDAWWCVPQDVPGACSICAAAPQVPCEWDCPNRDLRGKP